jgi:EAL domain-containing protein (putative c-di-GMP-specific phosphodiesterase class I)
MATADDIETKFRTAEHFAEALKQGQFTLYCQPIVPVDFPAPDYKYLEIFVRFREEEDNLLPPGTFFPLLEANHLTPLLDRWVVREVLRWTAEMQGSQPNWHVPRVNINLADDTVSDRDFPRYVRDQLKVMKFPPNKLAFEITTQQVDRLAGAAWQMIADLKALGCPTAVADFSGTEVLAASYKEAGVQIVKLEGAVVRKIHGDPRALSRLLALNSWCQKLGIQTIAEFVEQAETLPVLRKVGVNFAQGFGIAEPKPLSLIK